MPQDSFHYDKMIEGALRGVVRDALIRASRDGLPGDHHFYIGFATREPGVELPASLLARFPDEMTIVVQHQFWDLQIGEDEFSITLSFQRQPERLVIPFAAIKSFADPSVNFALEFAAPVDGRRPSSRPSRRGGRHRPSPPSRRTGIEEKRSARPARSSRSTRSASDRHRTAGVSPAFGGSGGRDARGPDWATSAPSPAETPAARVRLPIRGGRQAGLRSGPIPRHARP